MAQKEIMKTTKAGRETFGQWEHRSAVYIPVALEIEVLRVRPLHPMAALK